MKFYLKLYKDDFSWDLLISHDQLQLFYSNYSLPSANASIHDFITLVQGLSINRLEGFDVSGGHTVSVTTSDASHQLMQ